MARDRIRFDIEAADRFSGVFNTLGGRLVALNQGFQLATAAINTMRRVMDSTVGEAVRVSDSFRRTEIQLTSLTGSLNQARDSMKFLQDLAQQTPQRLVTLNQAFVRLKSTGVEDTERALKALTNAVAAFGGSDQDLQLAALAFQQMAGKGVISMEELRRQLGERIPTAIKIMAREMGISTEELFKKVEAGQVRATEGINALVQGMEKDFSGAAGRMMVTWAGATSNLEDEWDQTLRAMGDAGLHWAAVETAKFATRYLQGIRNAFKTGTPLLFMSGGGGGDTSSPLEAFGGGGPSKDAQGWNKLNESVAKATGHTIDFYEVVELLSPALDAWAAQNAAVIQSMEMLSPELDAWSKSLSEGAKAFQDEKDALVEFEAEALQPMRQWMDEMLPAIEANAAATENWANAWSSVGHQALRALGPIGGAISQGINLAPTMGAGPAAALAGGSMLLNMLGQNEEFKAAVEELTEALAALLAPIAEALAPAIEALVPILEAMQPIFELIGGVLQILADAIVGLKNAIESASNSGPNFGNNFQRVIDTINPFDGEFLGIKFHDGGTLAADSMLRFPGMAADEGLFLGQVGERVLPRGRAGKGGDGDELHFHISGWDEEEVVNRISRKLEERRTTGRFLT